MDPACPDVCDARWTKARDWCFHSRAVCSDFQHRKKCLSAENVDWNSKSSAIQVRAIHPPSRGSIRPRVDWWHAWRTEPRQVVVPQNSGVKHTPRTLHTTTRVSAKPNGSVAQLFLFSVSDMQNVTVCGLFHEFVLQTNTRLRSTPPWIDSAFTLRRAGHKLGGARRFQALAVAQISHLSL